MTDLDYQKRFSKNQNIPERHIILLHKALKNLWRVYMTNWWPKDLSAKGFDAETREVIKIHERIRQLEERVNDLESKK